MSYSVSYGPTATNIKYPQNYNCFEFVFNLTNVETVALKIFCVMIRLLAVTSAYLGWWDHNVIHFGLWQPSWIMDWKLCLVFLICLYLNCSILANIPTTIGLVIRNLCHPSILRCVTMHHSAASFTAMLPCTWYTTVLNSSPLSVST